MMNTATKTKAPAPATGSGIFSSDRTIASTRRKFGEQNHVQ
jgi:hypothetical protein